MAYELRTDFLKDFPRDRTFGQMTAPYRYVTIHNAASSTDARAVGIYGNYNSPEVSYHYAVDESDVYHLIPLDWTAWHSGHSVGNRESIGIEIARDMDYSSERYARAEENAAILSAWLLKRNGLGLDALRRHYDWNGKICPHRMFEVEAGKTTGRTWAQFKALVGKFMAESDSAGSYTVKSGDTLAGIAKEKLGDANLYRELAKWNSIDDSWVIFPGQVLRLTAPDKPAPTPGPTTIRLKAGTPIHAAPPSDWVEQDGIYTVAEQRGQFGRLKTRGWVLLPEDK